MSKKTKKLVFLFISIAITLFLPAICNKSIYLAQQESIKKEEDISNVLLNKIEELYNASKYKDAIPLAIELLEIRKRDLGKQHIDTSQAFNILGTLYLEVGEYDLAEMYLNKALEIRETLLGRQAASTATVLNNLARVYSSKGNYEKAKVLYIEVLTTFANTLGKEHPDYLVTASNIAKYYQDVGDYTNAENLYNQILISFEKVLGKENRKTITVYNNLASLYQDIGEYTKAETLFKQVLEVFEKVFGKETPNVAVAYNNLGGLYKLKKEYEKAENYYQKSLEIRQKNANNNKPDLGISTSMNNLGQLFNDKKEYEKAEPLLKKALAIREELLGLSNPLTASSQNNLANLYTFTGEYEKAEELYKKSLAIREKVFGEEHPWIANALNNLALFYQQKEDYEKAIDCRFRANEVRERLLERSLLVGSERRKLTYLSLSAKEKDLTISLHLKSGVKNKKASEMALIEILRKKGRILDSTTNTISFIRERANEQDKILLDKLAIKHAEFSSFTLRGNTNPKEDGLELYKNKVKRLTEEIETLESEISSSSELKNITNKITLQNIQKTIPNDTILIEITIYQPYDLKTEKNLLPRYVVYTLDREGKIDFVDLGEKQNIDQAVSEFRQVLIRQHGKPLSDIEREVKPRARTIDKLIMEPIRKLIGEKTHLLISPDGELNLIPFAAFVDEKGQYLVEKYDISYLTSGRDLLRLQTKHQSKQPPVIIAAPEYGFGKGPVLAGKQYSRLIKLPGTLKEADSIKNVLFTAQVYTGENANKKFIKELNQPELLHIATHGYFFTDTPQLKTTSSNNERKLYEIDGSKLLETDYQQLKLSNSLLKSWLFFAGANSSDIEKGVMTALEITTLNLLGTKLVTLSACETALGDIKQDEGVYGLKRALVLAGTETQLLTLWAVNDNVTKNIMAAYYEQLRNGKTRSKAMRDIQLELLNGKENNKLQVNKSKKKLLAYSHPYYWASFILSGEWKSLQTN